MQAALAVDPEAKRQLLRQAEASLRMCLSMDSSDARGYVVLGKLLVQQKRYDEARKLYADGTTATGEVVRGGPSLLCLYNVVVWQAAAEQTAPPQQVSSL
jgi:hypothetical protein